MPAAVPVAARDDGDDADAPAGAADVVTLATLKAKLGRSPLAGGEGGAHRGHRAAGRVPRRRRWTCRRPTTGVLESARAAGRPEDEGGLRELRALVRKTIPDGRRRAPPPRRARQAVRDAPRRAGRQRHRARAVGAVGRGHLQAHLWRRPNKPAPKVEPTPDRRAEIQKAVDDALCAAGVTCSASGAAARRAGADARGGATRRDGARGGAAEAAPGAAAPPAAAPAPEATRSTVSRT